MLVHQLQRLRRPDGGFPTSVGGASEVEPTTVAAIALRDDRARGWLASHQRGNGGFDEADGRTSGPSGAALASLVLRDAQRARRALAFAIENRGLPLPNAPDPERREAWGWTSDARSLVEPTSRVLLAVNALTPSDASTREEAMGLLEQRQCDDGGWNFGNASVYDVDLRGYAQTTAIALIALQGAAGALVRPAIAFLRRAWPLEPGGFTAAQALLAFRFQRVDNAIPPLLDALNEMARRPAFLQRPLTVAWAALAAGPDLLLDPLRSRL
jgi:hypothetical protein